MNANRRSTSDIVKDLKSNGIKIKRNEDDTKWLVFNECNSSWSEYDDRALRKWSVYTLTRWTKSSHKARMKKHDHHATRKHLKNTTDQLDGTVEDSDLYDEDRYDMSGKYIPPFGFRTKKKII